MRLALLCRARFGGRPSTGPKAFLLALALVLSAAPASGQRAITPRPRDFPNVLVVLVDDVGVDKVEAYGEHPAAGPTPNIDTLASAGLVFSRA